MTCFISLLLPKYTLHQWEGRKKKGQKWMDFNGYHHLLVYNSNGSGHACAYSSENATSWTGTESVGNSYIEQEFEFKKMQLEKDTDDNTRKFFRVQILTGSFTENKVTLPLIDLVLNEKLQIFYV